jgi:hypothetical protein
LQLLILLGDYLLWLSWGWLGMFLDEL